jgi:hypothetical protein
MEFERPSGLALTGHDDNYNWIELMARSPSGEIVARAFVRRGNHEAIGAWRKRFNNAGVSHSICGYASPARDARYVVPFYLHTRSETDLEGARRCLIEAGEQVLIQMDGPPASGHWFFDGNLGFELLVPFQVFDAFYSPWIFALYADIAAHQDRLQPGFLDLSIYSQDYAWTLPNSRHSQSRLYKIPLTEDEITELSTDQILAMTTSPRRENSYLDARIGKYAPWWFTAELKRIEQELTACPRCSEGFANYMPDRTVVPCVQAIESGVLPHGTRHATYFRLASVYAGLNMHYPEIVARLQAIDASNPICDSNDIETAAEHGCRHPSYPPCDSVLRRYCPKDGCELADPKQLPAG